MNWLSQTHSQDGNEEEREEGNFVMTCNLVSRSSAHILHLEQALLSVSNQRQHVGGAHIGSPKVCVKSRILPSGGLLVVPSSRFLNMHYHAIWKLLEQRSLLLFIHEYTRRAHLAAAYVSQVDHLLDDHLKHSRLSSNLGPLISHPVTPTIQQFPLSETIDMLQTSGKTYPNKIIRDPSMDITQNKIVEKGTATEFAVYLSSHVQRGLNDVLEDVPKVDGCAQRSCSVQWSDLGQPMLFDKLSRQYSTLLWACCSKALALEMQHPHCARSLGSVNLSGNCRSLHIFEIMTQVLMADILPSLCKAMLEEFSLNVLISAAHAHWDYVVCRGLGASLNDKCLTAGDQYTRFLEPSSNPVDSVRMSMTVGYLLQLTPPLLSALSYCHASGSSNLWKIGQTFHRLTVSLTLTTIQLFTVWVMSKAYQFLSSWSLNKFFLITQGDLEVLRKSLDKMVQQTKSLMNSDCFLSTLHSHNEFILMEQLQNVDSAYAELQNFSSLVLRALSDDCKRMSAHLFEQMMPSVGHWRLNPRPGNPMSPNEYPELAAQNVIGQVLDCVMLLSNDVCIQALSLTMTAFMEAWMEHILKQQIKFSVQGALQLKQDFDSIREFICSDRYGLPEELLQPLLSLSVFHQVDSAVLCLLQQPHVGPHLQSGAWESFTRCCPSKSSRNSLSAAGGSSIANLGGMDADYVTQSSPSVISTVILPMDQFIPGQPYLAPSLALGASHQDWLDLRIHTSSRRWRLPLLQCLSKSEQ
ncbi:coiled-coil domain-containing protein 142 isoform X4 [Stigmatopora nigra]